MQRNSRFSAMIALALLVPSVGLVRPSLAEPSVSEGKHFLKVFPLVQIVSMDIGEGTIKVLAPRMFERKTTSGVELSVRLSLDVASNEGEVVTLPLADDAKFTQVSQDEEGSYSAPISPEMLLAALDKKQHIFVGLEKNDAGEMEVQQLTLFADQTQKSLSQILNEHFGMGPSTRSRIIITK